MPGEAKMRRPVTDAGIEIVDRRRALVLEIETPEGEAPRLQCVNENIERAGQLLTQFGQLRPSQEGTLGVALAGGSTSVSAVVRRLDEAGIAVDSLDLREPSLDDVFAQATGYRLEGADAASRAQNFPESDRR